MAIHHAAVIFILLCMNPMAKAASFYGDSHVSLPFSDASSSTSVHLRFKTVRSDGLLLLASGTTDYLSIQLNGGIVELRADFGSGEVVITSQPNVRLDDGRWHQVSITRSNTLNFLEVDGTGKRSAVSPGTLLELNIQDAIYVGGTGGVRPPSGLDFKYYRGCMSNVVFNKYKILEAAQRLQGMERTFKVTWGCDEEFDASITEPISFTTNSSFVLFSNLHITAEGSLSLEVKTKSPLSLLLFNNGQNSPGAGLLAIEIINRNIQLTLDHGGNRISVKCNEIVSDGRWHQVQILFHTDHVVLVVDSEEKRENLHPGTRNDFSLTGHLFVGGVGLHGTHKAIKRNLKSVSSNYGSSLLGCVKNIQMNSRYVGFPQVQVSKDVSSTCKWTYPCASDPCIPRAECVEEGDTFRCICDVGNCQRLVEEAPTQQDVGEDNDISDSGDVQLVLVQALEVTEGSQQIITTQNIQVLFDHSAYGIRESAIQFHIISQPRNGRIKNTLGRRRNNNVFTLLDLEGSKIFYQHNGSELPQDDVSIEMNVISDDDSNIPERLVRRYSFVLPIKVIPVNDPPVLTLLNNGHIKIVRSTKIPVSNVILSVDDPDSEPNEVIYNVLCPENSHGFFERYRDPGQVIRTFTQEEVSDNMIWFVNRGETITSCKIGLTDGTTSISDVDLNIEGVTLAIQRTVNEGARLLHGSQVLLTEENLFVETNVPTQDLEILYEITRPPSYGQIQRLQVAEKQWIAVSSFAQRHINHGQVRYVHTDLTNLGGSDHFTFIVSCMDQRVRQQTFTIALESVNIDVVTSDTIRISKGNHKRITTNELWVLTNNENVAPGEIVFTVLRAPIHGHLFRVKDNMPLSRVFSGTEPLKKDASFTLQDVEKGVLVYQLSRDYYSSRRDFIDLKISAPGARPNIKRFHIEFVPEEQDVRFVINQLDNVIEGGQRAIERSNLYLETIEHREFEYTVVRFPKHGVLQIVDPRSTAVIKSNISRFTNEDVRNLKLVYKHDDSETDTDSFTFTAVPLIKNTNQLPAQVNEITDTLRISILMRNDNPPVRQVDKVFRVVSNQEKIITLDDLAFTDPDIDYNTDELMYTRRGIPNGDIVFTTNKTTTYQFTQKEIRDGQITFQHSGDTYGRTAIWVSDGQYYTTSLFEIEASDPEISIVKNTGLLVNGDQDTPITTSNLSIETNVNIPKRNIRFIMIEEPLYGKLMISGLEVTEFTLDDLVKGQVMYAPRSSATTTEDFFRFAAVAGEVQVQGRFIIRLSVRSRKHPPRIVHNEILEVMETGVATISTSILMASHPDSLPSMIAFVIKKTPQFGQLLVNDQSGQISFTQADINEGQVKYSHSSPGLVQDSFIFEVTNGFQTLRGLEFIVQVIQSTPQLQVQNFTVREGGRKVLTPSMVRLQGRYYDGKDTLFRITRQPRNGWVEHVRTRGHRLSSFSSDDLQQGAIFFVHDNGELASDQMALQARLEDEIKDSNEAVVYIAVDVVNDQGPHVVVNRGLDIWRRSITVISVDVLRTDDIDSGPDLLVYTITQPTNGRVTLLNNTFRPISSFTQALINRGQVVFVHQGENIGEFSFYVSDGVHGNSRPSKFEVRAKTLLLELVSNMQLNAYPGRMQPITQQHLFARTNDPNQTHPIIYSVEAKPRKGRIVTMFNEQTVEVQSFQQEEVNEGQIYYEHTSQMYGWSDVDLFFFQVSTLYADSLTDEMFDISISYTHLAEGEINDLIHISDISVQEGGEVVLGRDVLDVSSYVQQLQHDGRQASVVFVMNSLPKHGTLQIDGQPVRTGHIFTQEKIDTRKIMYTHDDSDTILDSFTVMLNVESFDGEDRRTAEEVRLTVNITIQPVNDQRFEVITREPDITVVQGLQAYITSDDLKTIDPDTPPQDIRYEVTAPPQNGFISNIHNAQTQIARFSQKDIDDRKVIFTHDGISGSSSFRFRVSDGEFPSISKVCIVNVIPLSLDFIGNKTAWLLQGMMQMKLGVDAINIRTNGIRNNIVFNVTKQPMYGELFKDQTSSVLQFGQSDVDNNLLGYRQHDLSSHMDYFMCDVYYPNTALLLRGQRLTVMVKPLVRQGPLLTPSGTVAKITRSVLDAGELANKTNSNPHFNVLEAPRYGKLLYHVRGKRDTSQEGIYSPTDSFTYEDVVSEKVFYQPDGSVGDSKTPDSFTFLLTAPGVQPAKGTFYIELNSNAGRIPVTVTVTPRSPIFGNSNVTEVTPRQEEVVSPNVSNDYVIILAILIPLLVLIVLVLVVVFILWRKRHEGDYLPGAQKYPRPYLSGSMHQVDQPHVHITPQEAMTEEENSMTKPGHTYFNVPIANVSQPSDHTYSGYNQSDLSPQDWELQAPLLDSNKTEVSPTVPECKVTPLGHSEEVEESESLAPTDKSTTSLDLYNWSLSDPEFIQHCRTTTPVLRENQYWV